MGRTGSGKSTLAMLLLGLYQPTEGTIAYDGVPLAALDMPSLRRQFGVVLQESALFSGTIRENISFHDPGLSLDDVVAAAQAAAVHEDIMRMPMGYETHVAEGGRGLSGGQLQRIALARALATRPAILLLDEATSHLDVVTEQTIERHLSGRQCTRIVVAHRLSTVCDADRILVVDHGRLVEQGTHTELLAQDRFYAALVKSQSDSVPASGLRPLAP